MTDTIRRVIMRGRLLGTVETRNMFTYKLIGVAIEPTATDYLFNGVAGIYGNIMDYLSPGFATYQMDMENLVGDQWYPLASDARVMIGDGGSEVSSFQTAVLMSAATGVLRVLGRKYFAGICESATTDGLLSSGALPAFAGALADYLSPVSLGGLNSWLPGVVDKAGVFQPFIAGYVGNILSTMRRRKPGYGI